MTTMAHSIPPAHLERTVRALCPVVSRRIASLRSQMRSEHALRRELVGCILGSQVRQEAAIQATSNLADAGLLSDYWWRSRRRDFEANVLSVLSGRHRSLRTPVRYRFPKARSRQLRETRDTLLSMPLAARLSAQVEPRELRKNLIAELSGLGPKQASMFLRNTGITFELAILDTHVLKFIVMQRLAMQGSIGVHSIRAYERTELILIRYAESVGYPPGCLDIAIWATMRAATELTA